MTRNSGIRTISAPITVNYEVTHACNLLCQFCYAGAGCSLIHPPFTQVTAILDQLRIAGVFEIGLFGGEFFFYPYWRETMEYAYRKGFFMTFVSNGTLIQAEQVSMLRQCNIHQGGISIHGPESVHDAIAGIDGTYKRAINGLQLCLEAGLKMSVLTTVTRQNLGLIYKTVEELQHHGLVHEDMSYVVGRLCPYGRGEREWQKDRITLREYLAVIKEIVRIEGDFGISAVFGDAFPMCMVPKKYRYIVQGCWMATGFGHIGHTGNVKACGISQHVFGNMLQMPLQQIWQSPEMVNFRKMEWLPDKCLACTDFCGGGCIASRISSIGYGPDEFLG